MGVNHLQTITSRQALCLCLTLGVGLLSCCVPLAILSCGIPVLFCAFSLAFLSHFMPVFCCVPLAMLSCPVLCLQLAFLSHFIFMPMFWHSSFPAVLCPWYSYPVLCPWHSCPVLCLQFSILVPFYFYASVLTFLISSHFVSMAFLSCFIPSV